MSTRAQLMILRIIIMSCPNLLTPTTGIVSYPKPLAPDNCSATFHYAPILARAGPKVKRIRPSFSRKVSLWLIPLPCSLHPARNRPIPGFFSKIANKAVFLSGFSGKPRVLFRGIVPAFHCALLV